MQNISPTLGRIVVSIDTEFKNNHTFESGLTIRIERKWNNLDRRHTEPVNAFIIEGGGIPVGAEVLIHHNASHPCCQIFNVTQTSGSGEADPVKYFSIPETQCYLWRVSKGQWQPMRGFATGLRVFEPVATKFYGFAPVRIENVLWCTSGEYLNQVVHTLRACDFEIIFRNEKGIEEKIIRFRHFENIKDHEREEIIAVNHSLTKKVLSGELYVGLTPPESKPLKECLKKA